MWQKTEVEMTPGQWKRVVGVSVVANCSNFVYWYYKFSLFCYLSFFFQIVLFTEVLWFRILLVIVSRVYHSNTSPLCSVGAFCFPPPRSQKCFPFKSAQPTSVQADSVLSTYSPILLPLAISCCFTMSGTVYLNTIITTLSYTIINTFLLIFCKNYERLN